MSKFVDLKNKAGEHGLELTITNRYTILNFGRTPRKCDRYKLTPIVQPIGARASVYTLFSTLDQVKDFLDTKCSQCSGDLVKRDAGRMTAEQAWCGEWHDCHHCGLSMLSPSPEFTATRLANEAAMASRC